MRGKHILVEPLDCSEEKLFYEENNLERHILWTRLTINYALEVGDVQNKPIQKYEGDHSESYVHGDKNMEIDFVIWDTEAG